MDGAAPPVTEAQLRAELAAVFRLTVREGWHEGVANHFSAALPGQSARFLINPRWRHFSRITASDLILCDADDPATMQRADAPDPSAWSIHSALHRRLPQARVALHLHPPYATALAALKDPRILPIDQVTARFFERLAYDTGFGGIATEESEGERIALAIGNRHAVVMQNHGVTALGQTIAEAWDTLYHLERAARTMVLALSTGRPLAVMSDALARETAEEWDTYREAQTAHLSEMMAILDQQDPEYRS